MIEEERIDEPYEDRPSIIPKNVQCHGSNPSSKGRVNRACLSDGCKSYPYLCDSSSCDCKEAHKNHATMISIEELSKRKLTKKGQNRATANHILQKVIEKFVELREEHKKAKDDFLKRELKYSILIEKLKDMKPEDVEEFTGDRIYRALKEHETKREVRPFYTITEEQLKNEVEPELMRRLDEILGEIKKIAEADD